MLRWSQRPKRRLARTIPRLAEQDRAESAQDYVRRYQAAQRTINRQASARDIEIIERLLRKEQTHDPCTD